MARAASQSGQGGRSGQPGRPERTEKADLGENVHFLQVLARFRGSERLWGRVTRRVETSSAAAKFLIRYERVPKKGICFFDIIAGL